MVRFHFCQLCSYSCYRKYELYLHAKNCHSKKSLERYGKQGQIWKVEKASGDSVPPFIQISTVEISKTPVGEKTSLIALKAEKPQQIILAELRDLSGYHDFCYKRDDSPINYQFI